MFWLHFIFYGTNNVQSLPRTTKPGKSNFFCSQSAAPITGVEDWKLYLSFYFLSPHSKLTIKLKMFDKYCFAINCIKQGLMQVTSVGVNLKVLQATFLKVSFQALLVASFYSLASLTVLAVRVLQVAADICLHRLEETRSQISCEFCGEQKRKIVIWPRRTRCMCALFIMCVKHQMLFHLV